MKRLGLLVIVLALLMSVVPLSASSVEQVTSLARYYPADTPFFFAMRTDDAFIAKIFGLVEHVAQFGPDGSLPDDMTLEALYEKEIEEGVTFGESIRPWLGDTIAFGVVGPFDQLAEDDDPPMLVALSITDREKAEAFVIAMLEQDEGTEFNEPETRGDFTVYLPKDADEEGVVAIGDEVAFIANAEADLPLTAPESTLLDNPQAVKVVTGLPANDYDMIFYADMASLMAANMQQAAEKNADDEEAAAFIEMMQPFMGVYGASGMGIVIGERTIGLDMVELMGDTSAFEAAGFSIDYATTPFDPGFVEVIPADANLVMLGTDPGDLAQTSLDNLRALGDFIQENDILKLLAMADGVDSDEAEFINNFNLRHMVSFVEDTVFTGVLHLDLEEDVLPWMVGDAAGYLRVLPSEETVVTIDAAVVMETADADATRQVIDSIGDAMERYDFEVSQEGTGPRYILAANGVLQKMLPPRMLKRIDEAPDLDILLGMNDTVAAIGTRPAVQYSLNPDGPGLAGDPNFVAAQEYFLPDSQWLAYINIQPLESVLEQLPGQHFEFEERIIFQLLESISITGKMNDEGRVGRLVITLSEAE